MNVTRMLLRVLGIYLIPLLYYLTLPFSKSFGKVFLKRGLSISDRLGDDGPILTVHILNRSHSQKEPKIKKLPKC